MPIDEQQPDPFAAAFNELTLPEGKQGDQPPASEAGEQPPAAEGEPPAASQPAAEDPPKEGEAPKEGEQPPASEAGEQPAAEDPPKEGEAPKEGEQPANQPTADDILNGLKKLIGERGEAKPEAKPEETPPAEPAQPDLYSEEEKALIAEYEKDWGDVRKGEALIRRGEYRELLQYIFKEVANFVTPIKETAEALATRTHLADIETNVPDYSDQLRDDVIKWVGTQPAYLQAAYNQVITQGTAEEVKDLIGRYRAATGKGAGAPAPTPPKKDNELSEPAKKAAAALAPVESKRSGVQQPSDPSNFDDAWKQAATELG